VGPAVRPLLNVLFALVALALFASGESPGVRVTYLANEGFLLDGGGKRVLIDALLDEGLEWYATVPDSVRPVLEAALPPFDRVDLLLITHDHADHFGPRAVLRYLLSSPSTRCVGPPQAIERIKELAGETPGIGARLYEVLPHRDGSKTMVQNGIRLRVLDLHHGRDNRQIQNLGYLFELGGVDILHVGDSMAGGGVYRGHGLHEESIEVALLPLWYQSPKLYAEVVEGVLQPGSVISMHVAKPGAPAKYFGGYESPSAMRDGIEARFPATQVAVRQGMSWFFTP